jgi:hypothetical protein
MFMRLSGNSRSAMNKTKTLALCERERRSIQAR